MEGIVVMGWVTGPRDERGVGGCGLGGRKRYDLNSLPDDMKELVRGMQVADAQLRMHEDTLKVLAVGRQSMAMQLNERLKNVPEIAD